MRSLFLPLFVAMLAAACHRSPPRAVHEAKKVAMYDGSGVLRKVDVEQRKAVIAHETIAGYMEAMTMEFAVAEEEPMGALQPGDVIAFRLTVTDERSWIDQLRKTGHADVAPLPGSLPPGTPLPDCTLVDQRGEAFRLADFKSRALAFTFIFTRCPLPDFCPLMNRNLAEVQRELSADASHANWHLLSISIDPAYDTPERLAEYARPYLGEGRQWTFATGEPADIQKLGEAFGLTVARDGERIDHTLRTVIVDAEGRVQKVYAGNEWQSAEVVAEMRRAMDARP